MVSGSAFAGRIERAAVTTIVSSPSGAAFASPGWASAGVGRAVPSSIATANLRIILISLFASAANESDLQTQGKRPPSRLQVRGYEGCARSACPAAERGAALEAIPLSTLRTLLTDQARTDR